LLEYFSNIHAGIPNRHFAERAVRESHLVPRSFTEDAAERLQRMEWSGNVRELRNTIERLLILSSGAQITEQDVDLLVGGQSPTEGLSGNLLACATFGEFKDAAERAYIIHKLRGNDWNVSETAREIDMPRSNLYKKIEKYDLVREEI
jgi:two-component system nitrogen regulation response regulator NtrX